MRMIDADALKDVIHQHDYPLADKLNSIDNGMFTLGIFQAIDQMPTVSPDEVRGVGKWIHFTRKYISGVDDEGVPMIRCSVCDYTQFESSRSSTNYCPSCGAKMEPPKEESE